MASRYESIAARFASDVESGDLVRTSRVDGTVDAIFELQDRLVREVATSLRAAMSPSASSPETEVVSAYEAFSRGLVNRRAETFESLVLPAGLGIGALATIFGNVAWCGTALCSTM